MACIICKTTKDIFTTTHMCETCLAQTKKLIGPRIPSPDGLTFVSVYDEGYCMAQCETDEIRIVFGQVFEREFKICFPDGVIIFLEKYEEYEDIECVMSGRDFITNSLTEVEERHINEWIKVFREQKEQMIRSLSIFKKN